MMGRSPKWMASQRNPEIGSKRSTRIEREDCLRCSVLRYAQSGTEPALKQPHPARRPEDNERFALNVLNGERPEEA